MEREEKQWRDDDKWVLDSSVDFKGNLPLRASTGAWRASLFIIVIEICERLTFFGTATSLIIYLTKVIHQDLKTAAKSANCWAGVTTMMALLGGFLADAYLGRFFTVLASSIIYILGLMLLIMSRFVPSLRPCDASELCPEESSKTHKLVFFVAIYLISIGTGGHKPALESFGADQFDDEHKEEGRKRMSFFNWWSSGVCGGVLFGATSIIFVQDHISWGVADIVLAAVMVFSLVILLLGRPYYRYRKPTGCPLTPILQVFAAAFAKRRLPCPSKADELYEVPKSVESRGRLLCHTDRLKFLDKAAIVEDGEKIGGRQKHSPWKLATVTNVEEAKLIMSVIPIWLSCLPFGICVAQTSTFFIRQATVMNLDIFHSFSVPPAAVFCLAALGMIITVSLYDRALVPVLRRITGNGRGISILQRIGIGMVFSAAAMVTAALVERKRLGLFKKSEMEQSTMTMSVAWLAPQFLIIGLGDGFALVGLQEYFYDQVPDSMRSLGIALYLSVVGVANFLSSLLITVVDRASRWILKDGKGWFGKDLNTSRLDNFYWLLAGVAAVNLGLYVVLASRYSYKNPQRRLTVVISDYCYEDGSVESAKV